MNGQEALDAQTVVVSRRVKSGLEEEFENLSTQMTLAASEFPGHMGATMFRPNSVADPEYRIVFKFADGQTLSSWLNSEVRASYVRKIDTLLIRPSRFEKATGLATWFTLPNRVTSAPPKYKMAIVSWIGLFPIVALVFLLFEDWLNNIPLVPRVALVTAIVMLLMTWVAMPWLTKLFSGWLYPISKKGVRKL